MVLENLKLILLPTCILGVAYWTNRRATTINNQHIILKTYGAIIDGTSGRVKVEY